MRILLAALLYFAIVFGVGLLLGPLRVLWLEPWLGRTIAVLCEAPVLLLVMGLAARRVPRRLGTATDPGSLAAIGIGALIMQQIADFAVGIGLRGITPAAQLAYLLTPPGLVYCAALVAFAAMPVLLNARCRNKAP